MVWVSPGQQNPSCWTMREHQGNRSSSLDRARFDSQMFLPEHPYLTHKKKKMWIQSSGSPTQQNTHFSWKFDSTFHCCVTNTLEYCILLHVALCLDRKLLKSPIKLLYVTYPQIFEEKFTGIINEVVTSFTTSTWCMAIYSQKENNEMERHISANQNVVLHRSGQG